MNCWEILGIDPTRDRAAIDRAYEQQKKFAAGEELERLQQAYREASGEGPSPAETEAPAPPALSSTETGAEELSVEEKQLVREVVIQVKALLNDSRRAADQGIWKAILAEPPADQSHIRAAVAESLEPQVRPMAENGSFPAPVAAFLGDWFGWHGLQTPAAQSSAGEAHEGQGDSAETGIADDPQPPTTNFWPAVIGWVVALALLAAVFDGLLGG